ncbi:uncharacterized protein LOC110928063 [Helianthus annuus]|uniref:uncharacterized protein LOC110928063 n=1 Tax=Helianthus annuus TaxID=4232 RepID=UPI000B8FE27F|nr:uncharacterized protein LOC110928063 [Helianthus annuus]
MECSLWNKHRVSKSVYLILGIKWASTTNKCIGKGLCGVNGYCVVMNDATTCRCIPGFEFINEERSSLGCRRPYTIESCKMMSQCVALLGKFTALREPNIRYLGLHTETCAGSTLCYVGYFKC